ncbi:hypothetical protein KDW_60390 [Dictyobacter vulcani]|uniref:PAS domain-containing protein n=1 Tax=Dictyobacter vulcani TaxID=2607529 RepID=A0A5J4KZB2_9CHLR|nr:PAS domain-containing protein [Dictyobacter vulcani]GER91877.1 hypothetical protein KDW_60390 [Dictyobacter vulcani]
MRSLTRTAGLGSPPEAVAAPFAAEAQRAVQENTIGLFVACYPALNRRFEHHIYPSPEGILVIAQDITERQQHILQSAEESEARFRTLADNISHLAWMSDESGWLFWYNQRWYNYTGTTLQEMQGWGWQKVHHPIMCSG